jgi:pimeloyl-ACP methyl ester carboxylesterase
MSESRLAARCIPNARLQVMHAGHLLSDDRPIELAQHLKRFLA